MRVLALTILLIVIPTLAIATPFDTAKLYYESADYSKALEYVQPLADQGNADAQNMLGDMYFAGRGVATNPEEALKWYKKAADQGNPTAQNQLASMYMSGQCVKQDYAEAAKWYRKAAEQGDTSAQNSLGMMYLHGQGFQPDAIEAYFWLSLGDSANRFSVVSQLTNPQLDEVHKRIAEWKRIRAEEKPTGGAKTIYGVLFLVKTDGSGNIASFEISRVMDPATESKDSVSVKVPKEFVSAARKLISAEANEANKTFYRLYILDLEHPDRPGVIDRL